MSLRLLASAGLIAAIAPVTAVAQNEAGDAGRNWAAIVECGAIDSAQQRHRCVDDVLQRTGVLSEARVAQDARQEFGREDRAEAPREAVASGRGQRAGAAPTVAAVAVPAQAAEIDELVTTIASFRTVGYRRLVVTTADGSVWEQTQAESFATNPKVGDPFSIERAAMGSYRCRFGSASGYRCERVD